MEDLEFGYGKEPVYIGEIVENFEMDALMPDGSFGKVSLEANMKAKKWTVLYFYPLDFTFVCPTEIQQMSELTEKFNKEGAEVIACSTDSVFSHLGWVSSSLGNIKHPMAADTNHEVSKQFNVYDMEKGVAWRGLFIIGPDGKLWSQYVNYGEAGRNAEEGLRNLQGCKAAADGKMVPCGWKPGADFVK